MTQEFTSSTYYEAVGLQSKLRLAPVGCGHIYVDVHMYIYKYLVANKHTPGIQSL